MNRIEFRRSLTEEDLRFGGFCERAHSLKHVTSLCCTGRFSSSNWWTGPWKSKLEHHFWKTRRHDKLLLK